MGTSIGSVRSWTRTIMGAASLLLLAACAAGTGGGTQQPTGTDVTVNVVDSQGRPVNGSGAFQVGDDAWESVAPAATGEFELLVPEGETRFGFAVNCPSGLQGSSTKIIGFHATVDETTELLATCPSTFVGSATTIEGNYDATAFAATDSVQIYTDVADFFGPGATPSGPYGPITTSTGSDRTIVAVAENAASEPVAVRILRNQNVSSAATVNINFGAGDAVGSVATDDFTASVPAGFSPNISIALLPENGQLIFFESEATAAATPMPTVTTMAEDDLYAVIATADSGGTPSVTVGAIHLVDSFAGVDLDLPEPWTTTPGVTGTALPTFTDLRPLPNETDFRGHAVIYLWEGIPDLGPTPGIVGGALIQFFVSSGWLGADTSFEVPNLTSLPGFAGARPLSGEEASWIVGSIASNLDTSALLSSPAFPLGYSTGVITPVYPPRVEGAVTRVGLVQDTYTVP